MYVLILILITIILRENVDRFERTRKRQEKESAGKLAKQDGEN